MKIRKIQPLENSITQPFARSMPYTKTAATTDGNGKKITGLEKSFKDVKKDVKDVTKDLKQLEKDLNLGNRRYWQDKTVWTSLQRKIERFERVELEWKKFKDEIDDKIKKAVEKKHRAGIK